MELIALTAKEVHRLEVIGQVAAGALTQYAAAQLLDLSVRQTKRLLRAYRRDGARGLTSKRRGHLPNNALDPDRMADALALCRGPYAGFGPTFAAEKLRERDGIALSRETLRRALMRAGLWKGKRRKRALHLPRERRAQYGELVQADGSPHDWFEGRGPKCTLLVTIDDATSAIGAARFESAETTDGYFELFEQHFRNHGLPGAIYVDRHEIFRINQRNCNADARTQVGRALDELGITLICANSPQAKGRVERLNRTCQDRLIKEMRLLGISTIAAANAFLPTWVENHNRRFAVAPACALNAHSSAKDDALQRILCRRYERVLSTHFTLQFDNAIYALEPLDGRSLCPGMRITIHARRDGGIAATHPSRTLSIRLLQHHKRRTAVIGSKDLGAYLDRHAPNPKKAHRPAANHPWKTPAYLLAQRLKGTSLNCAEGT